MVLEMRSWVDAGYHLNANPVARVILAGKWWSCRRGRETGRRTQALLPAGYE